jgi:hypothetical protein
MAKTVYVNLALGRFFRGGGGYKFLDMAVSLRLYTENESQVIFISTFIFVLQPF